MISGADMVAPSVFGLFKWRQFEPEVILIAVRWYSKTSGLFVVVDSEQFNGWQQLHESYVNGYPDRNGMGFIEPKLTSVQSAEAVPNMDGDYSVLVTRTDGRRTVSGDLV